MTGAGFPLSDITPHIAATRDHYLPRLAAALDRNRMCLLPGVESLLARLAPRPDLHLALLTGNWEQGARIKLSRFDLNRYFAFGAFGSDAIHRSDLPPIALARAADHLGHPIAPQDTLIIGDSIYDVACARDHDIPVLAVATGRTPASALTAAGATWVVPDLEAAEWLLG